MHWNDGSQYSKFKKFEEKQAETYRRLGMSEDAIHLMYSEDYKAYCGERAYTKHKQSFYCEGEKDCEGSTSLQKNFLDTLSTSTRPSDIDRFGWIEEIKNPALYDALCALNDNQKELLTLIYIDGYSDSEIAHHLLQISSSALHYRLQRIYKNLAVHMESQDGAHNE